MSVYGPVLEVLLKTTLLLFVGLLMGVALGKVSASRRHFLYGLTVIAALALAPITLSAPGWLTLETPLTRPGFALAEDLIEATVPGWGERGAGESLPFVPLSSSAEEASAVVLADRGPGWRAALKAGLAAGYLAGLTLLLGLLVRSLLLLRRLVAGGTTVPPEDWRRHVLSGLRGEDDPDAVGLLETDHCPVPFVWGHRSPVILIPADSRAWPEARLRGVLIHELAHVRQRDVLLRVAAEVLCAIQWMNPLTWMVARRLRADGEAACDDAVLAAGIEPTRYASGLLGLGIERRWYLRAAGAMSGGSPLGRRIEAVLDARRARSAITRPQRWGITACLASSFAVLVAADWQEPPLAPESRVLGAPATAPRPPSGPAEGSASSNATVSAGGAAVPVHVRWSSGSQSGAAFLDGSIDLDDDAEAGLDHDAGVGEPGLFLLFHRTPDGSIRAAHAVTDAEGIVQRSVLTSTGVSAWDGDGPAWIAGDLELVGLKLRALGSRVRWRGSPLSTYAEDPSATGVSGSLMTGLPATTEDGSQGSLVAGWRSGADRIGLLACAAPSSGVTADGARSVVRRAIEAGGDVRGLAEGECLVAFSWNADRAELRLFESYRPFGGSAQVRFSDGSRTLPSARAADWLLALLSSSQAPIGL